MCRHLAYLGPPVALDELLFTAPHSLAHQAERPQHQISGDTNPDGWGVAWYGAPHTAPEWYRTVTPVWADHDFAARAGSLRSGAFLAAARLASPGATLVDTGNAPFVDGTWSFSLNGIVHGFPDGAGDELRARVEPGRRARIVGDADTEVLFALVLQHLAAGMTPAEALATVVHDVLASHHRPAQPAAHRRCARARHARRQLAVPTRPGDRVRTHRRRAGLGGDPGSHGHRAHPRRRRRHPALRDRLPQDLPRRELP